jgi:type VI secretion system protein ImpE
MSQQNASELFAGGDLTGAISAITELVKKNPTDQHSRGLLAEFLCIGGELERADKLLDALGNQNVELAPALAMWRQVLRAEIARRDFYAQGRVPEFLNPPTPALEKTLQASIALRHGDMGQAAALLEEAESLRPAVRGECDGKAFDDLRDLDDLCATHLEVLTTTGVYYWVPTETVVSIEFSVPERPRDLIWRRALMMVRDGPEGEVFIPAVYANPRDDLSDQARLGRMTDWIEAEGAPVLGVGQRTFLVGEEAMPIMQMQTLALEPAG